MKRNARSWLTLAFGLALPAAGLAQGGTGGAGSASQPSGGSGSTNGDGYGTTYMTGQQQRRRAQPLPRETDLRDAVRSRDAATRRALGDEQPAPRRDHWWQFWRHSRSPQTERK